MKRFQIGIIGGGVIGCAIARELSKYKLSVVVFEKGGDVASATSKANSGVIHSGINSPPDSLKARFCVEGNKQLTVLASQLHTPLNWVGKYVIAQTEDDCSTLRELQRIGKKNGVSSLEIQDKRQIQEKEPHITGIEGLWVPSAGIVLPYHFTIALAENAARNNVSFLLNTEVVALKKVMNGFQVKTTNGSYSCQLLINAAGGNCRHIYALMEEPDFTIYPCRGEYLVLDKQFSSLVQSMIYPAPQKHTGVLGVHITPTIEGNILLGPSAEYIENIDDTQTTKETMILLLKEAQYLCPSIPNTGTINAYAGVRCKLAPNKLGGAADYRIQESTEFPGLIHLLGIESPGLTAAPAIAQYVKECINKHINLIPDPAFQPNQPQQLRFAELSKEKQQKLIKKNPRWGRIVCRCEHITEAEIIHALSNPLGARLLSSVKYRARAGMGRCQGGFCTQHIVCIMQQKFNMNIQDINLKSPSSPLFIRKTREDDQ